MLSSRFRLPGYLVPEVKKKGRCYHFSSFSLLVLENPEEKISRFGVILSLKFSKKAVVRNRTKRKILKTVRQLILKIKPGFLVIFLPKKVLIEKNQEEINKEIKEAFGKIKIVAE